MERSDKISPVESTTAASKDEAAEIDRIMKEIEELEKKMDSPELPKDIASEPQPLPRMDTPAASEDAKVVPFRSAVETMAETDAVPVEDAPLMKGGQEAGAGSGSLSLKIGGCTDVALEFTKASTTVYVSYNDDGLRISTDQGAEFKIPFKRVA